MKEIIERLQAEHDLPDADYKRLLGELSPQEEVLLFARAAAVRDEVYGRNIYIRGLIEVSSYCKNDCLYCGIRRSNTNAQRYRLNREQILSCCESGYELGFRTFVMQGGEDPYFTDERLVDIISTIRTRYPDCAITLSLGEKSLESYQKYFDAGANRYLLRHETADCAHYARLHPKELSLENRMRCLWDLKEIGYQTGSGFMIGSPFQTVDCLVKDLRFIHDLQPQMVGIGPFIPHHDTPFRDQAAGSVEMTLRCLAILRLMLPKALLPATTALGTIDPFGREKAMDAGANVIMPNLSPKETRAKYLLYDNKIATGDEAAESLRSLKARMEKAGYTIVCARGDYKA